LVSRAAQTIAGDIVRTPSSHSATLSSMLGVDVSVKFENLQFTGSFKDRGAANFLRGMAKADRERGVIALSAGNHAQGVAYHAGRFGIPATVVMPVSAPFSKVTNTRALGAEVVQHGATLYDATVKLDELRAAHGYTYVPPYDDPSIIAGQGTVALEMMEDQPDLDVLVVPIGGGGLASGVAVAAKFTRPTVEVIGVQVERYDMVAARLEGRPEPPARGDTLADGIAVKSPGEWTMPIIDKLIDDVVVVSEAATERAIGLLLEIEKTVVEGAGAVSLAAIMQHRELFVDKKVGLVLSGGNIDSRVLASVLMRGLVHSGRMATLRVNVQDLPGQLAPVVNAIASAGANIIEVDHRRLFDPISARSTNIDIVVEVRGPGHRDATVAAVEALGLQVERLG
jgi:threonine dehydratase